MSYHTPESKKEEFRRYLERSGGIDALTSVLVGLYEEPDRPPESADYIRRSLGGAGPADGAAGGAAAAPAPAGHSHHAREQEGERFRRENKELKGQVKDLNRTIETLRANLKHSREEAKRARSQNQNGAGGSAAAAAAAAGQSQQQTGQGS